MAQQPVPFQIDQRQAGQPSLLADINGLSRRARPKRTPRFYLDKYNRPLIDCHEIQFPQYFPGTGN